ncbi:hypothetical protein [Flavobacterium yafengii]|uniref:hypothetical protein n=1 Tax=Flavobacterium yafengii TaxID=3041253 RepID=UPI0024A89ED7|nr:hypothetical protein [Flavobacterium yafengii]MDI6047415.1 hypothetical protein [Flavobacterium yafengii]
MDSAIPTALPKNYIPEWTKLDFYNNSNLKADIQNRISVTIESDFKKALNSIKGDMGTGENFSEIVRLALAYFFSEIFRDQIKDTYYSLEMVKGFLDANNLTTYTAIHEIDVKFYKLNDTPFFKHCWLIIQSAWYFNSEHFGHHQHIDYVNHYIATGEKLPIVQYNFDRGYLEKKYNTIDKAKIKNLPINGFTLVSQWYYGILFLVCKELELPVTHFIVSQTDNREFNPITKTSRQLRSLAPFKIIECDIKSAFPTFLDVETGAKLKDHVYNNLMLTRGITRGEAKVLFNTVCNSGKYKSKAETTIFFLACGYTQPECEHLITLTHNLKRKFYSFMTEYERVAIQYFVVMNDLKRCGRLHDAALFIDNKIKPQIFKVDPNCDFGYKELNRPIYRETFSLSDKRLQYAYVSSIPKGLNLVMTHEAKKPEVKGVANGFIFYKEMYQYINAVFNINDFNADYSTFLLRIKTMLSSLQFLNKKQTKPEVIYLILQHIRANSQYVFNVKALYLRVIKFENSPCLVTIKERNYGTIELMVFKKTLDFLLARNEAEKIVNTTNNYYDLFCLMQERIINDDYGYLDQVIIKGHRRNNLLNYAIITKFNLLCTGLLRQRRKPVKSEPLYNRMIKGLFLKSLSLKPQQQNAFIQKGIKKYERELKEFNRLINNRQIAQQLFLIVCDLARQKQYLIVCEKSEVQNRLKAELIAMIDKKEPDFEIGAMEFDKRFKTNIKKEVPINSDLENAFDTDLNNSIFNQLTVEEASYRGDVFLKEYLQFHAEDEIKEKIIPLRKNKEVFNFPELDF